MIIAEGLIIVIGSGLLSGAIAIKVNQVNLKNLLDKVLKHDQQLNGNGQEGLIAKVIRVEEKVSAIKEVVEEIKEAVKK